MEKKQIASDKADKMLRMKLFKSLNIGEEENVNGQTIEMTYLLHENSRSRNWITQHSSSTGSYS